MASLDRDFFMDEIDRRFPDEPILVMRYGDHQPSATRDLINDVWGDDSPDVGANGSPGPFITFYAVAGHCATIAGIRPARCRLSRDGDTGCRWKPLPAAQRERKRLMMVCADHYSACEPWSEILAFHRRLINSGLVRTP